MVRATMRVVLLLSAVSVLGGCRGNFDALTDASPDGSVDAPPLPALACSQRAVPLPSLQGAADLTITSDDTGYLAGWNDPSDGSVSLVRFDRGRALVGEPHRVLDGGVEKMAGLLITPQRVWMVTVKGSLQSLWSVASDLSTASLTLAEDSVAGVPPLAVGQGSLRPVWVRGARTGSALLLSYLSPAGEVGAIASEATNGKVTELSFANYADHLHLGWRTDNGECRGSDVIYDALPKRADEDGLDQDCQSLRVTSGPQPHDPMVSVWRSSAGNIGMKYLGASIPTSGEYFDLTIGSGDAPKVDFDGVAYWSVWRDPAGLRIARVDAAGQIRQTVAVGYQPINDEAFELVRRGNVVDLVIREKDKMVFVALCDSGA